MHFKLWVERAQYDNDKSDFAGATLPIAIHNPKGEKIYQQDAEGRRVRRPGRRVSSCRPTPRSASTTSSSTKGTTFRCTAMSGNHVPRRGVQEARVRSDDRSADRAGDARREDHGQDQGEVLLRLAGDQGQGEVQDPAQQPLARTGIPSRRGTGAMARAIGGSPTTIPGIRASANWVGCRRPMPIWWPRHDRTPPEVVAEVEREIGPEGTIDVEIDTLVAKELHGDSDHQYTITAEVRDESRRTIVGKGKVLVARKPFKVFTWVDRGYYRVGDMVEANFLAQTLDHKPVAGKGVLKLLKITYDAKQQPIETPVQTWNVDTDAEGRAEQQIKASAKGQYRLSYTLTDGKEHAIEGGYIFTIVGEGFDGAEFRFNSVELVPDKAEYAPGETVKLQLNTEPRRQHGAAVRAADQRRLSGAEGAAAEGQEHDRRDRRREEGHAELLRRSGDDRRRQGL